MNTPFIPDNRNSGGYLWNILILAILVFSALLLYFFVSRATTNISEALAEEVLEQQRDVAQILHHYSAVSLSLSEYRLVNSSDNRREVISSIDKVTDQLEQMRSSYSFKSLDGAAQAHAYVKPVIEDVSQWITEGIQGYELNCVFQ